MDSGDLLTDRISLRRLFVGHIRNAANDDDGYPVTVRCEDRAIAFHFDTVSVATELTYQLFKLAFGVSSDRIHRDYRGDKRARWERFWIVFLRCKYPFERRLNTSMPVLIATDLESQLH